MPGSSPPPAASQHQVAPPPPSSSPPDPRHNHNHAAAKSSANARTRAPEHTPPPPPRPGAFSWSSSLLTMLTTLACFAALCAAASTASTRFALHAAAPVYGLYPPLVAAMLVGGCCALICYLPTMLAVLVFHLLFGTDIRKRHPRYEQGDGRQGMGQVSMGEGLGMGMGWSVLRDGASTIKLALVVAPVYVMALGRAGGGLGLGLGLGGVHAARSRALDAAAGGQLAAAVMTLRIMLVGVREIWDLVPLVMFRWDRDARAQAHEQE
ncbi:hypothetical protein V8D89_007092 [Ganoderma adspersum]